MDGWEGSHHRNSPCTVGVCSTVCWGEKRNSEALKITSQRGYDGMSGLCGKEMDVLTECFIEKLGCRVLGRSP